MVNYGNIQIIPSCGINYNKTKNEGKLKKDIIII